MGSFWHEDTPGKFETLHDTNVGFVTRRNLDGAGQTITMMGHLRVHLFAQKQLLIDGVNVYLKLTCSSLMFCIMRLLNQI